MLSPGIKGSSRNLPAGTASFGALGSTLYTAALVAASYWAREGRGDSPGPARRTPAFLRPRGFGDKGKNPLTAGPGLPAKNVQELIALAKAKPGQFAFASSGIGGAHRLSGEMLRHMSGIDIIHVASKGSAPAASDRLAGHVPMTFEMGYAALPSIKAGKIHALAVTSAERSSILPEVPTMKETGVPGFESYNCQGVIAPAGTPREIVERLNREINAILAQPAARRRPSVP